LTTGAQPTTQSFSKYFVLGGHLMGAGFTGTHEVYWLFWKDPALITHPGGHWYSGIFGWVGATTAGSVCLAATLTSAVWIGSSSDQATGTMLNPKQANIVIVRIIFFIFSSFSNEF
jgi:hypothetical protein